MGQWIWIKGGSPSENIVGCFRKSFTAKKGEKTILTISADTRYMAYINGKEIGQGPIRSTVERWFYDRYDITGFLDSHENTLAIRVWDYGMSTYQSIYHEGGLMFDVTQNGHLLATSDETVKSMIDKGIKSLTVKRNVNLGFMEYYDAKKSDFDWIKKDFDDHLWEESVFIKDTWGELKEREVKFLDHQIARPENIYSIKEIRPTVQSVSVNMRENFFPGSKDANAYIFSGFLGFYIECSEAGTGTLNFPNSKWNGIYGDYKIDDELYAVGKGDRKKDIRLKKGKQLFLMNISAKHDDLYSHMEFSFNSPLHFSGFFTIGPTESIKNRTDGFNTIYGGLENFEQMTELKEHHKSIFSDSPVLLNYESEKKVVPPEYLFFDEYILSLVENKKVCLEKPVLSGDNGLLHGNTLPTVLKKSENGNDIEVVIDFGDMFVGNISFSLNASEGTVLDIYGFENLFEDEIDYTFGLNNGIRYLCREGYQQYTTLTRLGFRYLILTLRKMKSDCEFFEIFVHQKSHPVGRNGHFRCNDYLINKIFEISRRTHQLCCEDTFADSPTYEQAFWAGDAQVSATVNAYYFGEKELVRNCIRQIPLSRKYTPLLGALMPTDWETAIPLWTMNWIIMVDEYVFNTGDESVIAELYEPIKTTLLYYSKFIEEDGAFNISAWNMIDWAPMDIYNRGVMTAQQGVLAHCFRILKNMAEKLGKSDVKVYDPIIEKLLLYIDRKLWLEETSEFADGFTHEYGLSKTVGMQTHIMLYKYNLITDSVKKEIVREKLFNRPFHWLDVGSPFMLFYLFEIWHKEGHDQRILNEISDRWGMMLRYDSSTCWEVFPGFYENSRTRSYCHSWSSAPGYVFIRYILGFSPVEQGFKKVELIIPEVDIKWCEGSVPTPLGRIDVWWSKENGQRIFRAKVPSQIEIINEKNSSWKVVIERI
ncbi:MAG: hypothetical protein JXQ23_04370 [Clostridia bacterium]|nr:hypothetical protein [Clostridia bacterium]